MTVQEYITSCEVFYHVTKSENATSILLTGLKPQLHNNSDYHQDCPDKRPQICLTTSHKIKEVMNSFQQNEPNRQFTIFEIPASYLATTNFGLDWTFSGTEKLADLDILSAVKKSIEEFGTIACFDLIPKEKISEHKTNL
jgi:hypothetical protein